LRLYHNSTKSAKEEGSFAEKSFPKWNKIFIFKIRLNFMKTGITIQSLQPIKRSLYRAVISLSLWDLISIWLLKKLFLHNLVVFNEVIWCRYIILKFFEKL
jgi:hypothetical protein